LQQKHIQTFAFTEKFYNKVPNRISIRFFTMAQTVLIVLALAMFAGVASGMVLPKQEEQLYYLTGLDGGVSLITISKYFSCTN